MPMTKESITGMKTILIMKKSYSTILCKIEHNELSLLDNRMYLMRVAANNNDNFLRVIEEQRQKHSFLAIFIDDPNMSGNQPERLARTTSQPEARWRANSGVYTFFIYKNHVYKNVEAQICLKFKNIVVILLVAISFSFPASDEIQTFL